MCAGAHERERSNGGAHTEPEMRSRGGAPAHEPPLRCDTGRLITPPVSRGITSGSLLGCFRPRAKLMGIAFGSAIDRRCLLKASLVAGVAVVVRPLVAGAQSPAFDTHASASGSEWRRTPATAARRIDGRPKVTGAKVYAADFRAVDMPGWPPDTAHAMLLKAPDATHAHRGALPGGGRP
jgi:hypothetical protein